MDLPQNALCFGPAAKPVLKAATIPISDEGATTRSMDALCARGDVIQLRPQQRVPLPAAETLVLLREGMLAIDAMPTKGKLQILDFLVAGDVVSASIVLPTRGVSLRSITNTSLVSVDISALELALPLEVYRAFLFAQWRRQLARVNIYQLMIGRLETEPRVATFLLILALQCAHKVDLTIALPMSRTDIANYLVINSDTLSRTMMRFRALGLIERANRHAVRVLDLEGLRKQSPLSPLLSAVFGSSSSRLPVDRAANAGPIAPLPSYYKSRVALNTTATAANGSSYLGAGCSR
jgi:CRP/FNR family transcriptional regulator